MRHEGSVGLGARELHDDCRQNRSTNRTQPNRVHLADRGDHLWVKFNVDPRLSASPAGYAAALADGTAVGDHTSYSTPYHTLHHAMLAIGHCCLVHHS